MRLKSLQIKGFKSFANDTFLHFNDDVIGIVGPNGSGKSNIVDAIRWVLGEQKSKELRLESMGDVIFNGTKTKKESASAMVALTFENTKGSLPSEYQFVTISRTLYRSGESEYRLNQIVCRLKDITSLFLDTGIGSNSYAIIALGMVDDILENKDNARRRMFEQAAGVSKYKMRKRETLLKLKNTDEDLNRIEDLLFEIDGNVKTLEKQAKRTQKYNEIKEKYKEISVKHAVYSIQSLKERYKSVAELLRFEQDKYRENDVKISQLHAQLEKDKKTNLDKELALNERQKSMNELVSKLRTMENEKVLLKQKVEFKIQSKDLLQKTIADSNYEISKLQEEVGKLALKVDEEMSMDVHLKDVLEKSKAVHHHLKENFSVVKSEFDEKQKMMLALEKEQHELEKNIAVLKNNTDNTEIEINRTKEELALKQMEYVSLQNEYETLAAEIKHKNDELAKLEAGEEERVLMLDKEEKKIENLKNELTKIDRSMDSKQNEFDLLKSMIDSFEGYPESMKFLSESLQTTPVILGEIIEVEEEYKAVIEGLLEPYLNYFVVETMEEAYKGVGLLSKAQKGKAYFFINNRFEDSPPESQQSKELSPAIQFVKTEDRYINILRYLLKDCFIFDGDIQELSLSAAIQEDWTILSRHGHFIKTKFAISGGSIGLFEGKKIGRKKNLNNLAKSIQDFLQKKSILEKEIQIVNLKISTLKQSQSKDTLKILKDDVNNLNQKFVKAQVQLEAFQKYELESQDKIKELRSANKLFIQQHKDTEVLIKEISSKRELVNSSDSMGNVEVTKLSDELTIASEKYNQDIIQLIRHQNLVDNLKKELEYKKSRIEEYKDKLKNDQFRYLAEEKESIDIHDQTIKIDQNLASLYEEKNRYNESLSAFEQAYFQTKNVIAALDDQIKNIQKEQNVLQNQIQNLKDEFTELKFKINGVGERLKIEFNIPVNDIINLEPNPDEDYTLLADELEKIKGRMTNYGEINPLALEAYNEMNERYHKILVQKNDIVSAKESLLETINEIETNATRQFHEAFYKIRENFVNVFRELFTGDDTCDLILENPNNPLDSEIEIIAKPKGKKPKSISQLSGGEKTLTATALLFALYLLKPAPFCIFDEVDAPLDDANIQKFNRIIQKFSNDSQFIIVTHNKATMVEVDILYGVYMQEPGVSAVSAVDFKKIKNEPVQA